MQIFSAFRQQSPGRALPWEPDQESADAEDDGFKMKQACCLVPGAPQGTELTFQGGPGTVGWNGLQALEGRALLMLERGGLRSRCVPCYPHPLRRPLRKWAVLALFQR